MTTTAIQAIATQQSTAALQQSTLPKALPARASSLVLAAVLTLAMLAGVDTLALADGAAVPQLAQGSTSRA